MINTASTQGSGVTVMVSTFNRAIYLRECLDSLLAQTLPADQIIVVDDGSSDETPRILDEYKGRIEPIIQQNTGKPQALNKAFEQARGQYLWIFDDDDVALPDSLERHVALLDANPGLGFTYSDYLTGTDGEDGRIEVIAKANVPNIDEDVFLITLLETCFLTTLGMLIRRHSIPGGYLFNPELIRSQDYDLFVRLASRCSGRMIEGPSFIRRYHSGLRGSQSDRFDIACVEEKWYRYEKKATAVFLREADLVEFLPRSLAAGVETPAIRLRALSQKACILARKGLWEDLLRTLEQIGLAQMGCVQIDTATLNIHLKALRKDLAVQELVRDKSLTEELLTSIRTNLDPNVSNAWARSLWYTQGDKTNCLTASDRRAAVRLVVRLLGPRGLVSEVGKRLSKPLSLQIPT